MPTACPQHIGRQGSRQGSGLRAQVRAQGLGLRAHEAGLRAQGPTTKIYESFRGNRAIFSVNT